MSANNPFDLTKLVVAGGLVEKQKYKPDTYTTEEQKEMLRDYVKVAREQWLQLPIGTNIRYIRKDGEMRKGGFIQYIDPEGKFMSISVINVANGKHWRLPLDGVAEIWKSNLGAKIAAVNASVSATTAAAPTDIQEILAALKEEIRQLKIEIQRVMNQQKRIIKGVHTNAMRLDRIEKHGRF